MKKRLIVFFLIFFTSMAFAQDFSSLFPFDKFSKWMKSAHLKGYQVAGVEDMSTDTSVSDRKYRAIFSGKQGMANIQLSQEKFFYDYKYSNDFKDVKPFHKNGFEIVYLSKPQMPMSFIRVKIPKYKATFSIMTSPKKDQKSMESLLEQIDVYKYLK